MKYRNRVARLLRRKKDFEETTDKKGRVKPGSYKK